MEKLKKGDYIGVVAPSDYIEEKDLEYINASISLMEAVGFKVKFGKYVFENTLGYGTLPQKRAEDINQMFKDDEVKAIFCAKGGEDSNCCLDYLDYELIKRNPKIICGFSDNTSVLDVINEKCNMVTFSGPTFKSLTSWGTEDAYLEVMEKFVQAKKLIGKENDTYITIKEGKAEGKLVGGNLELFSRLITGKYAVETKGKILFLEELGYEASPEVVNKNIYYLKQNGVFDNIAGLWVGNYEHPSKVSLEDIICTALEDKKLPIIKSNNFGHINQKSIIPIGAKAKIDTDKELKIELIEEIFN